MLLLLRQDEDEPTYREAAFQMSQKIIAGEQADSPQEAYQMALEILRPMYSGSGGAPSTPQTNEQVLAQAQELISSGKASSSDIKEGLIRNGYPEVAEMI